MINLNTQFGQRAMSQQTPSYRYSALKRSWRNFQTLRKSFVHSSRLMFNRRIDLKPLMRSTVFWENCRRSIKPTVSMSIGYPSNLQNFLKAGTKEPYQYVTRHRLGVRRDFASRRMIWLPASSQHTGKRIESLFGFSLSRR